LELDGIRFVSGMAGDIANAATRSLISGSDFGDNILQALPDMIGQTIGNAIADGIESNPIDSSFDTARDRAMYGPGAVQVSDLPPADQSISVSWAPPNGVVVTDFGTFIDGLPASDMYPGAQLAQAAPAAADNTPTLPAGVDWDFIVRREGARTDGYVPLDVNGNPDANSGVTIAVGFDLGGAYRGRSSRTRASRRPGYYVDTVPGTSWTSSTGLSYCESTEHHIGAGASDRHACLHFLLQSGR
jgi:hypothetical protein